MFNRPQQGELNQTGQMQIDMRQPLSMGQMAQLYANGPAQGGTEVQSYLSAQASRLGISGGAENFFHDQRAQSYNQAAAQQGRQVDLQKIAGAWQSPEMQRNAQIDDASAHVAQQAQQLAAMQTQQRLQQNPIGGDLTPLQTSEAQRQGMTPAQYTLSQRLGPNRAYVAPSGLAQFDQAGGAVSPEELFNHPKFQTALARDPVRSGQVFESLTGVPLHDRKLDSGETLPGYQSSYLKQQAASTAAGQGMLKSWLENRSIVQTPEGAWKGVIRGQNGLPDTMRDLSPLESSIVNKHIGSISPDMAKIQQEEARKARETAKGAQGFAAMQHPDLESQMRQGPVGGFLTGMLNMERGNVADLARLVNPLSSGISVMPWNQGKNSGDFVTPAGQANQHVAPLFRNAKFQALMQRDPASAQRLIAAARSGQPLDNSEMTPPAESYDYQTPF